MKPTRFGIFKFLALAGLLIVGVTSAHAARRTTVTNPPSDPPVVNEDAPTVSSP